MKIQIPSIARHRIPTAKPAPNATLEELLASEELFEAVLFTLEVGVDCGSITVLTGELPSLSVTRMKVVPGSSEGSVGDGITGDGEGGDGDGDGDGDGLITTCDVSGGVETGGGDAGDTETGGGDARGDGEGWVPFGC